MLGMSTTTTPTVTATPTGHDVDRLTCDACPGWWTTAVGPGERLMATSAHLADHEEADDA